MTLKIHFINEYAYVENVDRLVGIRREKKLSIGKLDSKGVFTESYSVVYTITEDSFEYFGPPYTLLNRSDLLDELYVYELRGTKLQPGRLKDHGEFVETDKHPVINFTDYKYSDTSPIIWNLPGTFRSKWPPPPSQPRFGGGGLAPPKTDKTTGGFGPVPPLSGKSKDR